MNTEGIRETIIKFRLELFKAIQSLKECDKKISNNREMIRCVDTIQGNLQESFNGIISDMETLKGMHSSMSNFFPASSFTSPTPQQAEEAEAARQAEFNANAEQMKYPTNDFLSRLSGSNKYHVNAPPTNLQKKRLEEMTANRNEYDAKTLKFGGKRRPKVKKTRKTRRSL